MEGEQLSWLKLNMIPGLTARDFQRLVGYYQNASAVFVASRGELLSLLAKEELVEKIVNFSSIFDLDLELRLIEQAAVQVLTLADDNYPQILRTISDPPPVLYIAGEIHPVDQASIAIVGSRKASSYGLLVAEKMASQLAGRGVTIVSGFAQGIDTAAHRGALKNQGRTLAILGCGLSVNYPASNYQLGLKIRENGALLSEFPMRSEPFPYNFPRRNRIISGLSLGTLVVEAGEKSGSLLTANSALEQNREVFAIPGNINSAYSKGANELIKAGAKLVNCCEDIIEEIRPALEQLGVELKTVSPSISPELEGEEAALLKILTARPLNIDEIIQQLGEPAEKILSLLSIMEIKGIIRQLPGKIFCLN